MRISDWSSDVCSSDLQRAPLVRIAQGRMAALLGQVIGLGLDDARRQPQAVQAAPDDLAQQLARPLAGVAVRSEERRVRKEGVSTCRSRGSTYHSKKKNLEHTTFTTHIQKKNCD